MTNPVNAESMNVGHNATHAPRAARERERLAALHRYNVLDTPAEGTFDRITALVARLLDVPIALVTFVDEDRQWFKSCTGLDESETPREVAFCNYNIRDTGVMVVEDATADPRFADNPFVTGPPHIRFYAGAPLVTSDGHALGSLCVIDTEPRTLSEADRKTLRDLAAIVVDELEMRSRHARRREVVESLDGAFFSLSPDWRFTYVNAQAEAMLRRSEDDLLGQNVWDAFPEALDLPFYEKYHHAVEEQETVAFEAYFPPLETWFRVKASPYEGGLLVYFDDVTDAKEKEQRLRLLSQALEDTQEAIVITDNRLDAPGPRIEYVNPAFTDMTGYTLDEVKGKTPALLQGPATDQAVLDRVRRHLENEESVEAEAINYRKDGTPYRLQWVMSPVQGEDGTISHWVSVQRDITEAYERKRELQHTRELLTSIIETASIGICVTDASGCFVRVNTAYTEFYGWDRDELIGARFTKVLPPEDRDLAVAVYDSFLRGEDEADGEWTVMRKDGTLRDVMVTAGRLEQDGALFKVSTVMDITSRKEAEEALRKREQLLATINAHVSEGIFRSTPNDGLVYANRAFADLFGYDTPKDVLALDDPSQLYANPERREELDQKERANGSISNEEVRFRRADGSTFYGLLSGSVVRDAQGNVQCYDGTVRDITRRKRAEQALARREQYLSVTLNSIGDAVIATDPDGRITQVNDEAERLTGWSASEARDRPLADVLQIHNCKTGATVESPVDKALNEGAVVGMDPHTVLQSRTGEAYQIADSAAPIRTEDGTLLGVVLVFRDISEMYERQEALHTERDLMKSIFNTSAAAITVLDTDGVIVRANERAREVLGLAPSDVQGRTYDAPEWHITAVDGTPFPEDALPFAQAMTTEAPVYDVRHAIAWPDGKQRILSVNAAPLRDAAGNLTGVVAVVEDITEHVETQQQLVEAKEEAESASRLKSALLANMSHEIRTPLTSIIGFSEILSSELDGPHGRFADRVHSSSNRLMETLNSVLQLSKLEANLETPDPAPVDLVHEMRDVMEMLEARAAEAQVTLTLDAPSHPVRIQSDRAALCRIAMNLVGNAIKFTETDGRVQVCVQESEDAGAVLEVEDTGIGIGPDFQSRLFDAFTQESSGLQREHEGSGLGLALVDRLVQLLGGQIEVESAKGEGTLFRVVLPDRVPARAT